MALYIITAAVLVVVLLVFRLKIDRKRPPKDLKKALYKSVFIKDLPTKIIH